MTKKIKANIRNLKIASCNKKCKKNERQRQQLKATKNYTDRRTHTLNQKKQTKITIEKKSLRTRLI